MDVMFGRFDDDPEFAREYMVVENCIHTDPEVYTIYCTPLEARDEIKSIVSSKPDSTWAVYELVEFVEVREEGNALFTDDFLVDVEFDDDEEVE